MAITEDPSLPANKSRETLSRQWQLLKLLPQQGSGASSSELWRRLADAGHPTTKRTVERDLDELSSIFALQRNEKSVPFGWTWTPPTSLELTAISLTDALTLRLTEESLRPLIPSYMLAALAPRFQQAERKLTALEGRNSAASWPTKVASVQPAITLQAPEVDVQCLENIQHALLDQQKVRCSYYSVHRDKTSQMTLNPLGLVQRGTVTYVIATADPYEDVRQYAVHRLREVERLQETCLLPDGFNLQTYISTGAMQFGDQQLPVELKAWVTPGLARLLQETPLSADMRLSTEEDGAWLLATVQNSWELEWWILSHTGSIVVHAPVSLRQRVIERLGRGIELYR
ncbi:helix-turn-helix transcriptional regulator [Pseudomonas sp. GG8]